MSFLQDETSYKNKFIHTNIKVAYKDTGSVSHTVQAGLIEFKTSLKLHILNATFLTFNIEFLFV